MSIDASWTQPWRPQLNWKSPAGQLLEKMAQALPTETKWNVVVFRSSPLQLAFDPSFLSADVDLFSYDQDLAPYFERAGLTKGDRPFYIDLCGISAFHAPTGWEYRSFKEVRGHVALTFPHPIDLLASKVKRLEPKDLRAFELVRAATGHPTETEFLWAMRLMVDIFKPSFDEEQGSNVHANVKHLWREVFKKEIDIPAEIIRPAIAERQAAYQQGGQGIKRALSSL